MISFIYFRLSNGSEFSGPTFTTDLNKFALVYMFHGGTPPEVKAKIMKQCSELKAQLCFIFATSSFGIGVGCSSVQQVIYIV